jgi:hypothetical protein
MIRQPSDEELPMLLSPRAEKRPKKPEMPLSTARSKHNHQAPEPMPFEIASPISPAEPGSATTEIQHQDARVGKELVELTPSTLIEKRSIRRKTTTRLMLDNQSEDIKQEMMKQH